MVDALYEINNAVSTAEISLQSIKDIQAAIESGYNALEVSKKELSPEEDRSRSDEALTESISLAMENAGDLYSSEVQDASAGTEYAYGPFKSALLSISDRDELVTYTVHGVGWARNINVVIDMNSVAGDIEDYANAVESARENLGLESGRDPVKASAYWKSKIYGWGNSLYIATIVTRLNAMSYPASFWSLLNDGTAGVSMSSDIGGTPYPRVRATRFVQKAERAIYRTFRAEFLQRRAENKERVSLLREEYNKIKQAIKQAEDLIERIQTDYNNAKTYARRLGLSIKDVDPSKLLNAVEKVRGSSSMRGRYSIGGGLYASKKSLAAVDY